MPAKSFSDERLKEIRVWAETAISAYPDPNDIDNTVLYEEAKSVLRFLDTIAADRKRIEILENREKLIVKKGREFEATTIAQAATIERLRGEKKERDDLLTEVMKMDLDIRIEKTIKDFYERQCQALDRKEK